MDGLGGVQKQGWRAGGTERGGNFLGNDAAFAHSGDDDAAIFPAAAKDQLDGAGEGFGHLPFMARGQGLERSRFGADQGSGFEWTWFTIVWAGQVHRLLMVSALERFLSVWGW
jgi:hypothetical protein